MSRARQHRALSLSIVMTVGTTIGCNYGQTRSPQLEPTPLWPAADSLFQRSNTWMGADDAYSVDLGDSRVLWLFGDTWIDPSHRGTRDDATMVSNSLAVQHGYDPTTADISYYWGGMDSGSPVAFLPDTDSLRFWPGHGAMVGEKLILFWMDVASTDEGIGFAVHTSRAMLVDNPADEPSDWQVSWPPMPTDDRRIIVGSGGVLLHDGHLYAHGAQEPGPNHSIFLVRWPESDVAAADLVTGMQWWGGEDVGWISGLDVDSLAMPVARDVQTEFTVHWEAAASRFQLTHSSGFGPAVIVGRYAEQLTGPWSAPDTLVVPPHNTVQDIMIYQGKAHPYLEGGDLVMTYSTNSFDFSDHLRNPWLYYPRFARNPE